MKTVTQTYQNMSRNKKHHENITITSSISYDFCYYRCAIQNNGRMRLQNNYCMFYDVSVSYLIVLVIFIIDPVKPQTDLVLCRWNRSRILHRLLQPSILKSSNISFLKLITANFFPHIFKTKQPVIVKNSFSKI